MAHTHILITMHDNLMTESKDTSYQWGESLGSYKSFTLGGKEGGREGYTLLRMMTCICTAAAGRTVHNRQTTSTNSGQWWNSGSYSPSRSPSYRNLVAPSVYLNITPHHSEKNISYGYYSLTIWIDLLIRIQHLWLVIIIIMYYSTKYFCPGTIC